MGKLALTGEEAKPFLNGLVTNDVESLEPGRGLYAAFLTPKGKMLGDLRIFDRGHELLIVCERVALQSLFDLLRRGSVGWGVELHKRTLEMALISIVGEDADASFAGLGRAEHDHVAWGSGIAARTDLGVDVIVPAQEASKALALAPDPSEEEAEVMRVERGRPRYGIDLDDSVIPQEADLNGRAVSFTKGCYVGQETVARLYYKGKPNRHLRGLRLEAPAQPGEPVVAGEREVGRVGSAVVSPRHGPIALALLRREVGPGDEVAVGTAAGEVVELPF
jgi:folate-binding protein YgfZ